MEGDGRSWTAIDGFKCGTDDWGKTKRPREKRVSIVERESQISKTWAWYARGEKKKKISTSPLYSFTMKILNSLFVKLARILTVRVTTTFFHHPYAKYTLSKFKLFLGYWLFSLGLRFEKFSKNIRETFRSMFENVCMFKFDLRYTAWGNFFSLSTTWSFRYSNEFLLFFLFINIIYSYIIANNHDVRERDDISASKFKSYFRATFVDTR